MTVSVRIGPKYIMVSIRDYLNVDLMVRHSPTAGCDAHGINHWTDRSRYDYLQVVVP